MKLIPAFCAIVTGLWIALAPQMASACEPVAQVVVHRRVATVAVVQDHVRAAVVRLVTPVDHDQVLIVAQQYSAGGYYQAAPAQPADNSALIAELAKLRAELAGTRAEVAGIRRAAESPAPAPEPPPVPQPLPPVVRPAAVAPGAVGLLNSRCSTCHSDAGAKGGLVLFQAGQFVPQTEETFTKIIAVAGAGTMPPAKVHAQFPPLSASEVAALCLGRAQLVRISP